MDFSLKPAFQSPVDRQFLNLYKLLPENCLPNRGRTEDNNECGPSGAVVDEWVKNMSPEKPKANRKRSLYQSGEDCGPSGAVVDEWVKNMSPEKPKENPKNLGGLYKQPSKAAEIDVSNMVQQVVDPINFRSRMLPRKLEW